MTTCESCVRRIMMGTCIVFMVTRYCFAGYWYCLRTAHQASVGNSLTEQQILENENMKIARVSVEWSYARAEQLWPALNNKHDFCIERDAERSFAEIKVMYLLTNFKVCCTEGSTMTGMFRCPPPSLEDYMNFIEYKY